MLLDTCIAIDLLRGNKGAVEFIVGLEAPPSISVVTLMELEVGVRGSKEASELSLFVDSINAVGVEREIAVLAGRYYRNYKKSHGLDPLDALIGATASHQGLALATLNVKHFPMFEGLERPY